MARKQQEVAPQEVPELEKLMGVPDVQAYLGVCRENVFKLISEEGLPHIRLGKLYKFQRHELALWLQRQSSASQQQ